jgi:Bestrophin, RFP-TM, chloride channel
MISPKQPHLGKRLTYFGWPLLLLFVWDGLVALAYVVMGWTWIASKSLPLALYGSAIGVIVGFRNNSAYGRWWEARGQWGQIVNNSRSLARQVCTTITNADEKRSATQRHIVLHQITSHAVRAHFLPAASDGYGGTAWVAFATWLDRCGIHVSGVGQDWPRLSKSVRSRAVRCADDCDWHND